MKFFFIWKLPPLLLLLFAWYIFLHPLGTLHLLHMYVAPARNTLVPITTMQHMSTTTTHGNNEHPRKTKQARPGVMAEKQEGWERRGLALWSLGFWEWALCISGSHGRSHQRQGQLLWYPLSDRSYRGGRKHYNIHMWFAQSTGTNILSLWSIETSILFSSLYLSNF